MRRLTSPELNLLLERGTDALDEWTAPEVVEALAVEVSERRLDAAVAPEFAALLRDALAVLEDFVADTDRRNAPWRAAAVLKRAAEAGIGEGGK